MDQKDFFDNVQGQKYTDFAQAMKSEIEGRIKTNDYVVQKSDELEKFIKTKEIFQQISDLDKDPDPEPNPDDE